MHTEINLAPDENVIHNNSKRSNCFFSSGEKKQKAIPQPLDLKQIY